MKGKYKGDNTEEDHIGTIKELATERDLVRDELAKYIERHGKLSLVDDKPKFSQHS